MKNKVIWFLLLSFLISSCAGTKYTSMQNQTSADRNVITSKNTESQTNLEIPYQEYVEFPVGNEFENSAFGLHDQIISTAMDNLGVRYRYGGTTKSGFDCSGLVYTAFKEYDISLPRSSSAMADFAAKIKSSEAQKGDLIFFITNGGRRINHVGIITEVNQDEIKFIHSSTQLGVIISSTSEAYYKKNFVKVARVL